MQQGRLVKTHYLVFPCLQENNAVAVVDVEKAEIRSIHGLGFKDHSLSANKFDPSDQDNSTVAPQGPAAKIDNWPVFGMYQPDEIASYRCDLVGFIYAVMKSAVGFRL